MECKASSKPWVLLTSEDALSNYNRLFAFAITSGAARKALIDKSGKEGHLETYLQKPSKGGYGFRQALGKNDDVAYAAAIGALKACRGIANDRTSSTIPRLAFAFPVIVVDSPLFECSLEGDGELHLQEVKESEFLFSAHIPDEVGCCIKVIKNEKLADFATQAKHIADAIRLSLKDEEDAAIKQGT